MRLTYRALVLVLLAASCGDDDDTPGNFDSAVVDGPVAMVDGPTTTTFDAPTTTTFDARPTVDGATIQYDAAATPPVDGAAPTYDAAIGVPCGDVLCDTETQQCCMGISGTSCIPVGDTCTGAAVSCDGPEDCSGTQVCCATISAAPTVACGEPGGETCPYQLCGDAGDCPAEAAACCPLPVFSISVCMAQCMF